MIGVFSKKLLLMTNSAKRRDAITEALDGAGIKFKIKQVDRHTPGTLEAAVEKVGTIDAVSDARYNFYIYISKKDEAKARTLVKDL